MRLAVFSDVHGNPAACRAVLEAVRADGPFDGVVAAGDLCFAGSDPALCLDLLREAEVSAVYGNTEVYLLHPEREPPDWAHLKKWDRFQPIAYWARERLGPERLDWLASLPLEVRFSPSEERKDDLLVVHANPRDPHATILPPPETQRRLREQVEQPDDDPELAAMLEGVQAAVLAFGHFHYPFARAWRGLRLVDVAPVSISPYDGDERARYSVFTWEGGGWRVERRAAAYDYRQEAEALRASDMPFKEDWIPFFQD